MARRLFAKMGYYDSGDGVLVHMRTGKVVARSVVVCQICRKLA